MTQIKDLITRIEKLEIQAGLRIPKDSILCIGCTCVHHVGQSNSDCSGFTCHCGVKWSREEGWNRHCLKWDIKVLPCFTE